MGTLEMTLYKLYEVKARLIYSVRCNFVGYHFL